MGKIIGSWLLKVHQHAADEATDADIAETEAPPNETVKAAVIEGLRKELGGEFTVSLIEKTDD